ncbi:hypothetical protein Ac2012v2_002228 [Leucoagaricus gongylophorus]
MHVSARSTSALPQHSTVLRSQRVLERPRLLWLDPARQYMYQYIVLQNLDYHIVEHHEGIAE